MIDSAPSTSNTKTHFDWVRFRCPAVIPHNRRIRVFGCGCWLSLATTPTTRNGAWTVCGSKIRPNSCERPNFGLLQLLGWILRLICLQNGSVRYGFFRVPAPPVTATSPSTTTTNYHREREVGREVRMGKRKAGGTRANHGHRRCAVILFLFFFLLLTTISRVV